MTAVVTHSLAARRLAALLACVATWPTTGRAADADPSGTYRLRGTARIAAGPALDRTVPVHADALVERTGSPGSLRLTVGAAGTRCQIAARIAAGGALSLAPGQRCALDLDSAEARGHLDVVLRSGAGRLSDDVLALEIACDINGQVSLRTGGPTRVLGQQVDLPAGWTPAVPVNGEARARAEGGRDHSRAAQPAGR
jgi:hypothetical protein